MRDDAASRLIIIDDSRIDKTLGNDSSLDNRLNNQVKYPLGNLVNFSLEEKFFVTGSTLLHLSAVDVTLTEEIS